MMLKLHNQRGITVIELIVVIGMMAILACIALPKVETGTYALLAASKGLRDDIRYVRCMTMTEGQNLRVFFQRTGYFILEGPKAVREVKLHNDFSLYQNFTDSQVAFSYNGAPSTSGGTATLVNNKSKKYCELTVVPGTGRILLKNKVYSGYK